MTDYVVASSKPWHRDSFELASKKFPGQWYYVESPEELAGVLVKTRPKYIFFLHWNWRVPEHVWTDQNCVCFHMTDVPYGRGGSPLQNLILAGHRNTKLSALRMVEEMDAGPVYTKRELSLKGTAAEIFKRAGELSYEIIDWMVKNEPEPTPQTGEPTIFRRRKPAESQLPPTGDLQTLYDHIRMLDAPTYPKSFIEYGDFVLEFSEAKPGSDTLEAKVSIRRNTEKGANNDGNH